MVITNTLIGGGSTFAVGVLKIAKIGLDIQKWIAYLYQKISQKTGKAPAGAN